MIRLLKRKPLDWSSKSPPRALTIDLEAESAVGLFLIVSHGEGMVVLLLKSYGETKNYGAFSGEQHIERAKAVAETQDEHEPKPYFDEVEVCGYEKKGCMIRNVSVAMSDEFDAQTLEDM
jgi:hypothetical protein